MNGPDTTNRFKFTASSFIVCKWGLFHTFVKCFSRPGGIHPTTAFKYWLHLEHFFMFILKSALKVGVLVGVFDDPN